MRTNRRIIGGALVVFLATVGAARAEEAGRPYLIIQGGLSLARDADVSAAGNNILGTLGGGGTLESDPGFEIGGAFGYRFAIGLRLEGEIDYRRNDLGLFDGTITIGGAPAFTKGQAKGNISALGFLANAWYEQRIGNFLPYIGGGGGLVRLSADVRDESDTLQLIDDSVLVLGWQAGGGIGYEIQGRYVISADYRFFKTADPEFEVEFGGRADAEYSSHNFMVGFRVNY